MKKNEIIQGGKWLFAFKQIQDEANSIINGICPTRGPSLDDNFAAFKDVLRTLTNDSSTSKLNEFKDALEKLPEILERMKATPKSNVRRVCGIQQCEVKALDAFIEACILGVNWVQEPQNRGLEAAMFFRFTQAYKWWEISSIESSAFWKF